MHTTLFDLVYSAGDGSGYGSEDGSGFGDIDRIQTSSGYHTGGGFGSGQDSELLCAAGPVLANGSGYGGGCPEVGHDQF